MTRNQIAAYESHEIDDICDYLTAHEVLELPYTARSEYVLYRWNDVFDNAEKIRSMVDRLRFQVECYLHTLQGYWIGGDSVYFPLDHQNRSSMRHRSGFPIGQQSCGRRLQGIDAAAFRQNPLYVGRCCAICLMDEAQEEK